MKRFIPYCINFYTWSISQFVWSKVNKNSDCSTFLLWSFFVKKICTIHHNLQPWGIYHNYTPTALSDKLHTFRSQIYWFVIKDWTEVKWYFRFSLPTKSESLITLTLYLWADFYKYFSNILANHNVFINILNCFHRKVVEVQKEFRKQTLTWFHSRWV